MSASIFHRTTCRLCDSKDVELVIKLEPIPLSENYSVDSETGKKADRYPVDVYMCGACGHVHQLDVVDSKSLWENYTYFSGEAKGMPEHFRQVAKEIIDIYKPQTGSLVVDIGSNDGSLLKPFKKSGYRVLGIDPAIEVAYKANAEGIETIPDVITSSLANQVFEKYGNAKVICMFNAFAHADDMNEVAESIRIMLAPDGIFVFEAQYLLDVIDQVLIATIFHEHMSHHSVKPLVGFLDRHGMELIDIQRVPIQHGSIIGVVQHRGGGRKVNDSVRRTLELEVNLKLNKLETLKKFADRISKLKNKTKELVNEWRKSKVKIAGFGASRSGPTLIAQLGLEGVIEYIVDDHPQKVGRYSSGDGIAIVPTSELCKRMPHFTIILAWVHSNKIIQDNREYMEKGGHFVVLCPETRLVGINGNVVL